MLAATLLHRCQLRHRPTTFILLSGAGKRLPRCRAGLYFRSLNGKRGPEPGAAMPGMGVRPRADPHAPTGSKQTRPVPCRERGVRQPRCGWAPPAAPWRAGCHRRPARLTGATCGGRLAGRSRCGVGRGGGRTEHRGREPALSGSRVLGLFCRKYCGCSCGGLGWRGGEHRVVPGKNKAPSRGAWTVRGVNTGRKGASRGARRRVWGFSWKM